MSKHNDLTYLKHVLDSIVSIEEFISRGGRELFDKDKAIQNAIIRELEVIGEATRNITYEFREKHSSIPWKLITGMRDKLIHDYAGVDLEKVWEAATIDIPKLKRQVLEILSGRQAT